MVVDGAASLGTADAQGRGFGTGFAGSVVYSMHATKSFAVGEAGVIYSADAERIARLRTMNGFGFGSPRTATMAGINGKVCEVVALLGRLRLTDYDQVVAHRASLFHRYREALPELQYQVEAAGVQAHQFVPALLPAELEGRKSCHPCPVDRTWDSHRRLLQPTLDGTTIFPEDVRGRSIARMR